ncbi:AMP-binding protein [Nonomuraea sp. NPDC050663]|uniref:AMP-binding protein n=1 Tax=Nonomuraea sp. NPDC050663 TaxID=3364370 RepID=UPI0037A5E42C
MEPLPDWGTIPRMLHHQAGHHPDVPVLGTTTVRELADRATRVARGLMSLGVRHGDRVAVWGVNDATWVEYAFGVWCAGAVIVPLSARYKGIEAEALLAKTGTEVVLVGSEGLAGLLPPMSGLRHTIGPGGTLARDELLAAAHDTPLHDALARALAVQPHDLCEIMSTSGTTGVPKGVMLDHAQVLRGYWDWAEIVTLRRGDRYPVIAPFAHGFGLNAGLLACVLRLATMIPVPVFTPETVIDLIESGKVTVLAGAPAFFSRLLTELERAPRDLSSLRVAICGAAAVPPALVRRVLDEIGVERMINAYGLMEGTVVSMTRAGDPVEVIAATTGRPVPGIEVMIVDDDGKQVTDGERGEILQRGYGVMRGYWDDPARTAEAIDGDGWLHTGDVGYLDAAGNVAIVDRKKELFIVNGFNVSPAEVESLLLREGSLAQAAVVGMPDERAGECGWAFVVPRPGVEVEADALVAWARENMSSYKVPRRVFVVESLPVNANGKIDKLALRASSAGERG